MAGDGSQEGSADQSDEAAHPDTEKINKKKFNQAGNDHLPIGCLPSRQTDRSEVVGFHRPIHQFPFFFLKREITQIGIRFKPRPPAIAIEMKST